MKKRNILIVDDDCVAHLLIRKAIRSLGWIDKVDSAFNGKEGIEALENYCCGMAAIPDLILLDLHMPVMDGFQFLESFNNLECMKGERVVIAVLSSADCPDEKHRIARLGVRYFFQKPILVEKLEMIADREFNSVL